jgi:hypothetical protein
MPSAGEIVAKQVVYALLEDSLSYWIHRFLHTEWSYGNIHCVHHEVTTHSHTATRTTSRRQQRKLGLLVPSLSAGRTPTPPSRPPRRTRAPSLPKIYQYTGYWPRISHPMMHLLCRTGCKGGKKRPIFGCGFL